MRLTVLLADFAKVEPGGKVNALGLGWTSISTPTAPMAVVILADLTPEEQQESKIRVIRAVLCDASGKPVVLDSESGRQELAFESAMAIKPVAAKRRRHGRLAVAGNIGPDIDLPEGEYRWEASITGSDARAYAEFITFAHDEG
jgi:hypothetical protein